MARTPAPLSPDDYRTEQRCFLPDTYAITWAWNGNGDIMSYDPSTGVWTDYGRTVLPGGAGLGGFSMDINNNTNNLLVVYQRAGNLYTAPLDDPTNVTLVGPHNNTAFGSSYPCGAFRPGTEEYWIGIGSGSRVGVADLVTGEVTSIGTLKDNRDGAALQAGPGDWFFDPEGNLFLMARDTRGATFEQSTGTVLWQIDPDTLCTTRIGETDAPTSGTGASWQAAGTYLLSAGSGVYTYRPALDPAPGSAGAWVQEIPNAPHSINDLGNQWVVPEVQEWTICYEKGKNGERVIGSERYYRIVQDDADPNIHTTVEGPPTLPGTWDKCEKVSSPFVVDPISPSPGEANAKPTDKVWHDGCYDGGAVKWREDCDGSQEYLFPSGVTQSVAPDGFLPFACGVVTRVTDTRPFCRLDGPGGSPVSTVYQQEEVSTGEIRWFDETGTIPEPADKVPGECPPGDEETAISEQVICSDGVTYVRRRTDNLADVGDGLLEPFTYEIIWFNGDGTFYASGVTPIADPVNPAEPAFDIGDCVEEYIGIEREVYCEIPARYLLLIDSNAGDFARYSFLTKTWSNVSTLSVSSAGGSADVANRILYNFVAPDQMTVVDVNSDTQLPSVTLTSGVLKPGLTANPLTFSAASFRDANGRLYAWDTSGGDAGLYSVDVATGVVDFVTEISGVAGTGTSIMIDNTTDTLIINGTNLSYNVDWVTGVGTLWGDPPIQPNGGTFDTDGNAYVTQGTNTYCLPAGSNPNDSSAWVQIIDDWAPGANSIAYYEVDAGQPPEFECRYGTLVNGDRKLLGTYETGCLAESTPRTIVGEVVPCSYLEREKLEEQCALLRQIAANTASGGGATGPTAVEIADAIIDRERARTQGFSAQFTGNAEQSLPVAAGTQGRLLAILDNGGGVVYYTLDGTTPTNTAGPNRGTVSGPYHNFNMGTIDLSQVRLDGSAGASTYTVQYEVHL